ncbi:hypothetical protein WJX81_007852 [Elliptochloris bilobata]|uniref:Condensin complex subunit 2 n=1 Tax=Elliptochloris bilobata TaxID=381761 RepID=A0AAW1RR37_9CHLO
MLNRTLQKALQDIDLKRHRTNPFDERYLGLCLSEFVEAGGAPPAADNGRTLVESAACNVHARIELIRSMKLVLLKQSMQAVKQCQTEKPGRRSAKGKPEADAEPQRAAPGSATRFFTANALETYKQYKEGQLSFSLGDKAVGSHTCTYHRDTHLLVDAASHVAPSVSQLLASMRLLSFEVALASSCETVESTFIRDLLDACADSGEPGSDTEDDEDMMDDGSPPRSKGADMAQTGSPVDYAGPAWPASPGREACCQSPGIASPAAPAATKPGLLRSPTLRPRRRSALVQHAAPASPVTDNIEDDERRLPVLQPAARSKPKRAAEDEGAASSRLVLDLRPETLAALQPSVLLKAPARLLFRPVHDCNSLLLPARRPAEAPDAPSAAVCCPLPDMPALIASDLRRGMVMPVDLVALKKSVQAGVAEDAHAYALPGCGQAEEHSGMQAAAEPSAEPAQHHPAGHIRDMQCTPQHGAAACTEDAALDAPVAINLSQAEERGSRRKRTREGLCERAIKEVLQARRKAGSSLSALQGLVAPRLQAGASLSAVRTACLSSGQPAADGTLQR